MKQILFLFLMCLLSACKKNVTSSQPTNDVINNGATVIATGNFAGNAGYTVSGTAEVVNDNGVKRLVLKGFTSSGGPDLKVYLATNRQAGNFISLGNLKSTSGQQVYDISGMPDFTQYKFALIWCQQFSVLFGAAELK